MSDSHSPLLSPVKYFTTDVKIEARGNESSPSHRLNLIRNHVRSRRKLHEEGKSPIISDNEMDDESSTFVPKRESYLIRSKNSNSNDFHKHSLMENRCGKILHVLKKTLSSLITSPGFAMKKLIIKEDEEDDVVKFLGFIDLCKRDELASVLINIQAGVAITSSIMFWVGSQDVLTNAMFSPSLMREILFTLFGVVLLGITDTIYANAGLPGTFYSDKVQSYLSANLWLFVFRVSLGLIGSLLLWTGIYNIIDAYTVESSLYKDLVTLFVGFIGLALSGTFYDMSFVYPPLTNVDEIPSSSSGLSLHVKSIFRALVSITFQNCVWVGGYNLLENYSDVTPWRESTYIAVGLYIFVATNTFVPNSWIAVSQEGDGNIIEGLSFENFDKENFRRNMNVSDHINVFKPTLLFQGKAFLALVGQIMNNTGTWVLLDQYCFNSVDDDGNPQNTLRNSIYSAVGLFFLWISGALSVNACITPLVTPIWESPQLPDIQDIALMATVSQALESGEEDESSAGILNFPNNLKELQPSARGRFRSRIHKIDLRDLSSWMEKSQRNLLSDSIYQ